SQWFIKKRFFDIDFTNEENHFPQSKNFMTYKIWMCIPMLIIALSCAQPRDEIRFLSVNLTQDLQDGLQQFSEEKGWIWGAESISGLSQNDISWYSSVMIPVSA